jgi:hypothetical protein
MENLIKYGRDAAILYGYLGSQISQDIDGETYHLATLHSFLIVLSAKILSPSKIHYENVSTKFSLKNCLVESVGANLLIFCIYTNKY